EGGVVTDGALLDALKGNAFGDRQLFDFPQEINDRLVRVGGDADAFSFPEQVHDRACADVRLPRAGRALDEQVRVVEIADGINDGVETVVGLCDRVAGATAAEARQRPVQNVSY